MSDAEKANIIDIWQTVIETQRHFNDLAIRIRSFTLSILTLVFGALGYSIKEDICIKVGKYMVSITPYIGIFSLFIIFAFFVLDRHYHRLLIGSIVQGTKIEDQYANDIPEINLTKEITANSKNKFFCFELHSKHRINIFYTCLFLPLLVITIFFIFTNKNTDTLNYEYQKTISTAKYIIYKEELNSVPKKPGIIIEMSSDNKFIWSIETNNLYYSLLTIEENEIKKYYYPIKFGRLELANFINDHGISFKN